LQLCSMHIEPSLPTRAIHSIVKEAKAKRKATALGATLVDALIAPAAVATSDPDDGNDDWVDAEVLEALAVELVAAACDFTVVVKLGVIIFVLVVALAVVLVAAAFDFTVVVKLAVILFVLVVAFAVITAAFVQECCFRKLHINSPDVWPLKPNVFGLCSPPLMSSNITSAAQLLPMYLVLPLT